MTSSAPQVLLQVALDYGLTGKNMRPAKAKKFGVANDGLTLVGRTLHVTAGAPGVVEVTLSGDLRSGAIGETTPVPGSPHRRSSFGLLQCRGKSRCPSDRGACSRSSSHQR